MNLNNEIVQSNLLARGLLSIYSEDKNEMNSNLYKILEILSEKLKYYVRQGIDLEKEVLKAFEKFEKFTETENIKVEALPFVFRLILRNKTSNKKLIKLTREENKRFFLVKDDSVVDAKRLVDKFFEEDN